jgi:uncharacterized protein YlxP (DUF503 family)
VPYAYSKLKLKIDRCESLKEKRSILSALLTSLKKYNLSVIEKANQDNHHLIELEMTMVRSNTVLLEQDLQLVSDVIERDFPNLDLFVFEKEIYL